MLGLCSRDLYEKQTRGRFLFFLRTLFVQILFLYVAYLRLYKERRRVVICFIY